MLKKYYAYNSHVPAHKKYFSFNESLFSILVGDSTTTCPIMQFFLFLQRNHKNYHSMKRKKSRIKMQGDKTWQPEQNPGRE